MSVSRPSLTDVTSFEDLKRVLDDWLFKVSPVINSAAPSGVILPFAGMTLPEGWLWCDGAEYNISKYPELYKAIGDTWGSGTGTFFVPNGEGKLLYGADGSYVLGDAGPSSVSGGGNASITIQYIIKV